MAAPSLILLLSHATLFAFKTRLLKEVHIFLYLHHCLELKSWRLIGGMLFNLIFMRWRSSNQVIGGTGQCCVEVLVHSPIHLWFHWIERFLLQISQVVNTRSFCRHWDASWFLSNWRLSQPTFFFPRSIVQEGVKGVFWLVWLRRSLSRFQQRPCFPWDSVPKAVRVSGVPTPPTTLRLAYGDWRRASMNSCWSLCAGVFLVSHCVHVRLYITLNCAIEKWHRSTRLGNASISFSEFLKWSIFFSSIQAISLCRIIATMTSTTRLDKRVNSPSLATLYWTYSLLIIMSSTLPINTAALSWVVKFSLPRQLPSSLFQDEIFSWIFHVLTSSELELKLFLPYTSVFLIHLLNNAVVMILQTFHPHFFISTSCPSTFLVVFYSSVHLIRGPSSFIPRMTIWSGLVEPWLDIGNLLL